MTRGPGATFLLTHTTFLLTHTWRLPNLNSLVYKIRETANAAGAKISWTIVDSGLAVRLYSEGQGNQPSLETIAGEDMPQYVVAIHHPDDYDPSLEDEAMDRDIDVLNDEMVAAGVRIFVGGLHPASSARSLRPQPNGKVLITDGPYLETKEHVGGFWVLKAANLDEALAWGRKAAVACRAPVEVREVGVPSA
jgi:hypothetical protein